MPKMTNTFRPDGMSVKEWQLALRQQAALKEEFPISERDVKYCPGEYIVRNPLTRSEYKVVYRGVGSEWNYCSCMDFKTSGLGTCKHLEAVKLWVKDKRRRTFRDIPLYSSVYVDYKDSRKVKIRIGEENRDEYEQLAGRYFDKNGVILEDSYGRFDSFLSSAHAIDPSFRCYDDALDIIIEKREKSSREKMLEERYSDSELDHLLTAGLYPYQKDGVRFAIKAGKAIIADEMGLGKTIQAIAAAEIYLREGMAESVLIVCPTTLKYQWKKEIEKFTGSDTVEAEDDYVEDGRIRPKVIVIEGNPARRQELYMSRAPYKIVSYHTVTNDIRERGKIGTDVLIMDEIQRLKNWNTLISKAARKIESRWSVLLSGTPLENKLEELFANMELVDQFCLGPYYLFRERHILTDPVKGTTIGYKNLNSVGRQINDRLIRRTKKSVRLQLPKRSDQYILVPMTEEQASLHAEFNWDLSIILRKYEKYHFITEQDRKRIMLLLAQMRMVSDSTFILDQDLKSHFDVKIDELMNILQSVFEGGDAKVVIFSEWERMTRLVAMELDRKGIRFEYLNGSIPAKKRGELVNNFTTLPESRVFISTDAGSTGLNLQVASILVNMDLPWNPAVLEQRVARIYRLGQENPVQIINLVSKNSIEEGMIEKLRFKSSMFEGVLDGGADTVFASEDKFKKFMEDIKNAVKITPATGDINETVEEDTLEKATGQHDETPASPEITRDDIDEIPDKSQSENDIVPKTELGSTTHPSPCTESSSEPAEENDSNTGKESSPETQSQEVHISDEPQSLINQGVSFLSGLAGTLKSPEATEKLVDSIVEVDQKTGQTNIKIPVTNKDTVLEIFSLFGKLLQK